MKIVRQLALFVLAVGWPMFLRAAPDATNSASPDYPGAAAQSPVETVKYDWQDTKRGRPVPVKIYYPAAGAGPFPVIVFSHGLGGSREGYEYLGRHWAAHGYVSVHVQHAGSDSAVWQNARAGERLREMERAALNLQNAVERPRDVSFAIDQITKLNGEPGALQHRLDLDRIGVAGHSFGGHTALAIAGEVFPSLTGNDLSAADPRVKAAIAMSSPVPANPARWDRAFAKIHIPVFHMTGTRDDSPIGETKAVDRRVPYDHINGADQFLLTLQDADHMVFSGRLPGQPGRENDAKFQPLILLGSTAFWDAYLKGDRQAKAWLTGGGFAAALNDDGKFEQKKGQETPAR